MDKSREQLVNFSLNLSRKSSNYSDISFMNYTKKVKAQSNLISWTDQIDNKSLQSSILFYTTVREKENIFTILIPIDKFIYVSVTNNTYVSQIYNNTLSFTPQSIDMTTIPYIVN